MDKKNEMYLQTYFGENKFLYVDIGATGGVQKPWSAYIKYLNVHQFDPDKRADLGSDVGYTVHPFALDAVKQKRTLYLTKKGIVSSLYEPDQQYVAQFPIASQFEVIGTEEVTTHSFDEVIDFPVSFVKIDTQGSELDILQGAAQAFTSSIVGVEVETNFTPRYKESPQFGDIDVWLRKQGFMLFDLSAGYWKRKNAINYGNRKGQIIMADALYISTPERLQSLYVLQGSRVIHELMLMCSVYGYYDYAYDILLQYKSKLPQSEFSDCLQLCKRSITHPVLPTLRISQHIYKCAQYIAQKTKPYYARGDWYDCDEPLGNTHQ